MLTLAQIRENKEFVIERLLVKGIISEIIINQILVLDQSRRQVQVESDAKQNEMNNLSKNIGILYQQGCSYATTLQADK